MVLTCPLACLAAIQIDKGGVLPEQLPECPLMVFMQAGGLVLGLQTTVHIINASVLRMILNK